MHAGFRVAAIGIATGWPGAVTAQAITPIPSEDRSHAVDCLTLAIAYEAGHEIPAGQRAVADVVLNRVRTPGFPKTVCGVVFEGAARRTGCQFTFTCDGALHRKLPDQIFAAARLIAEQALAGGVSAVPGGATHYHAAYVFPYWAPRLVRLGQIGAHIFYRRASAAPSATASAAPMQWDRPPPPPADSARPVFAPWGLVPSAAAAR